MIYKNIFYDADVLFPRYIAFCPPAGITGLVLAGWLAAAMSSLSSGLNSAASVLKVDWVDRWRRRRNTADANQLRETRSISLIAGALVILLSLAMEQGKPAWMRSSFGIILVLCHGLILNCGLG